MDIKSSEQSFQNVTYKDDSYRELISHLQKSTGTEPYHLSLFIGRYEKTKQQALQQILDQTGREVLKVDANELVSKIESDTYKNLDNLFEEFSADNMLLYLNNGSRLCGAYTGYSQSSVKYATPQERYFLKKVQQKGGLYIIDIAINTDADETIKRAAQSIIDFPGPQSGLKKFLWKLRQIVTVHGYQIKTERPEHYHNKGANF